MMPFEPGMIAPRWEEFDFRTNKRSSQTYLELVRVHQAFLAI